MSYINFVIETSSRTHFKENMLLIKDLIGTMPLKSYVSYLSLNASLFSKIEKHQM